MSSLRTHASSIIYSVSNICSNVVNFPAKKLRKIRCSKYACADFFFFFKYILSINRKFSYSFSSCIIIYTSKQVNKVKYSVSVSTFIVLQYTLNKSQKFHTQQIILFVLSNFQLNQKRC